VGQSAYYAIQTGKKAGIVLTLETMKDRKYWIRLNTAIEHCNIPIDTWSAGSAAYSKYNLSTTLYSKVKEVNTATRNIKKIYYRVDKKTTS